MGDLLRSDRPTAARVRPPSWRDPRLALGIALVLGATVTGAAVVSAADDSVPVLAASRTLTPGDQLDPDAVAVVRVRLDSAAAAYLPADEQPAAGLVSLRTIAAGELLPRQAVGTPEQLAHRPVAVPLSGVPPEGLARGGLVDVWVSERLPDREYGEPVLVVPGADVVAVSDAGAGLAATGGATAHVLLDTAGLRAVLGALANEDRVDLVPVPGSAPPR